MRMMLVEGLLGGSKFSESREDIENGCKGSNKGWRNWKYQFLNNILSLENVYDQQEELQYKYGYNHILCLCMEFEPLG